MKTLSIQQPWAWLIVNGLKDIENRTWRTTQRGRILVHAGKKMDTDALIWLANQFALLPITDEHKAKIGNMIDAQSRDSALHLGGIVGAVTITGCVYTSDSSWFNGPYGFELTDGTPLPFTPYKGQLGFFEVGHTPEAQ